MISKIKKWDSVNKNKWHKIKRELEPEAAIKMIITILINSQQILIINWFEKLDEQCSEIYLYKKIKFDI